MLRRDLGPLVGSYLRAGYPYLALCSHEEERVLGLLSALCREQGRPLLPLSMTTLRRDTPEAGPLELLERIRQHHGDEVFAVIDFHPWIAEPLVVRTLRDLRMRLEHRDQTVVFISPNLVVPDDLESEVQVIDVPLPLPEDLQRLLEGEARQAEVELDPGTAEQAVRAVQGLTAMAARRAFRRACQEPEGLASASVAGLVAEKRRILRRTDLLEFVDTPPSLESVGGLGQLKDWLVERESAFGEEARRFGLPTPKGLLLVGVQGCGKSLTAKAVAHLWNLPLARLDFGSLFKFGRSPESNLRRVLRLTEGLAPVVLWIDEIDKAFSGVGQDGSSETLHRLLAAFITWLQEKTAAAFVVATANAVDQLPPELLRKGRFDEIFFVDLPNQDERSHILRIHLAQHQRDPATFEVEEVAGHCEHFSGAELAQVVVDGLHRAFRGKRELTTDDLRIAAKTTVPLYRTYEEQIKALREWSKRRARRASTDARIAELWGGSA